MCLHVCLRRFTLSSGYFGLSLNMSRLHSNPYLSCFISAAVEVPAYIQAGWLCVTFPDEEPSSLFFFSEECPCVSYN